MDTNIELQLSTFKQQRTEQINRSVLDKQNVDLTNHLKFLFSIVDMGVFAYLVFSVPVYVLEILEGLYSIYVFSALLGNTF